MYVLSGWAPQSSFVKEDESEAVIGCVWRQPAGLADSLSRHGGCSKTPLRTLSASCHLPLLFFVIEGYATLSNPFYRSVVFAFNLFILCFCGDGGLEGLGWGGAPSPKCSWKQRRAGSGPPHLNQNLFPFLVVASLVDIFFVVLLVADFCSLC